MYEEKKQDSQEILSIEEYLYRRRKLREEAEKTSQKKEKSPVFLAAELLV